MKRATSLAVILGAVWAVAIPTSVQAAPTGRIVMSGLGNKAGIFSMLPNGTDVQRLYTIPQDWAVGGLDAAADGSMIAMTFQPGQKGHIYVMNADGSGFAQVTSGVTIQIRRSRRTRRPWSSPATTIRDRTSTR